MAALIAAVAVTATSAFANPPGNVTSGSSQIGNIRPLDCLNVDRFSGVFTVTHLIGKNKTKTGKTGVEIDLSYTAQLSFQPNMPGDESFAGSALVQVHTTVPASTVSVEVPVAVPVSGSQGSNGTLNGTETLFLVPGAKKNTTDVQIAAADDWAC
jgi:hypothetical protein